MGLFQENLRLAVEDPRRRFLFCIRGDAGVGKSFLLRQFIRLTRERGYATAYVDESVFDIPTVMDTLAADLARQDKPCKDFTKRSEVYRKHRHELDADPAAPDGLSSALTRSAVRIGLRTAEDIPLVGPFAKELNTDAVAAQADQLRSFLSRKFRNQHDVRLMLAPVDELTPTFVNDLRAIASHQPVALFFDTYEQHRHLPGPVAAGPSCGPLRRPSVRACPDYRRPASPEHPHLGRLSGYAGGPGATGVH